MSAPPRSSESDRLAFDFLGGTAPDTRGLGERLRDAVGGLPHPWNSLAFLVGVASLYFGAVLACLIVVSGHASALSLAVGIPLLVGCGAIAAHLVPKRFHESGEPLEGMGIRRAPDSSAFELEYDW